VQKLLNIQSNFQISGSPKLNIAIQKLTALVRQIVNLIYFLIVCCIISTGMIGTARLMSLVTVQQYRQVKGLTLVPQTVGLYENTHFLCITRNVQFTN
jgi:hypothetical protein